MDFVRLADATKPDVQVFKDAADYLARTGRRAPQYNPSKPIKTWEDPTAIGATYQYDYIETDPNGVPFFSKVTIPSDFAASVNLDVVGTLKSYADWLLEQPPVLPGDKAAWTSPFSPASVPLQVNHLFSQADAVSIAGELSNDLGTEFQAVAVHEYGPEGAPYQILLYDPQETRRVYQIRMVKPPTGLNPDQVTYMLEVLFLARMAGGMWAPGKWGWTYHQNQIDYAKGPVFSLASLTPIAQNYILPIPIDPKFKDSSEWELKALFGGSVVFVPVLNTVNPLLDIQAKVTNIQVMLADLLSRFPSQPVK